MSFYDAIRVGASGAADFEVQRSLRFNRSDEAYLEATLGNSNLNKWTLSVWVKKPVNGEHQAILASGDSSVYTMVNFGNSDRLKFTNYPGSNAGVYITTRKFRDPGAWYHIVAIWDSGNSTAADRIRLYVNGVRETAFDQSDNPNQNQNSVLNGNTQGGSTWGNGKHRIGRFSNYTDYTGCYYAEVNFVDGQAYDPSYFAETNSDTGQWNPKKYAGSYGTNGFYLKFADNSGTTATTLGKDSSGNGNNFTLYNLVTGDSVKDTPTNNFAILRMMGTPFSSGASLSEGNLKLVTGSSGSARNLNRQAFSPILVNSGKWYAEFVGTASDNSNFIGVGPYQVMISPTANNTRYAYVYSDGDSYLRTAGSESIATYGGGIPVNNVVGVYLDMDASTPVVYFSSNGQWADGSGNFDESNPTAGLTLGDSFFTTDTGGNDGFAAFILSSAGGSYNMTIHANFGQDSTFAGLKTAGGNTDANGIGDFAYPVPTGAKALCSANLPDPTILLPNQHFNTLLYSGDGSGTRSITGVGFKPDWVWIKGRNTNYSHLVYNSVIGAASGKGLNTNEDRAEGSAVGDNTTFGFVSSFDSDGFSIVKGSDSTSYTNGGSSNYVSWNWNAGDTDSKTYTVKVVSDSGNKYRFDDFGTSAVTLDLAEGGTYTFDQSDSSMSSHPMQLSTTANGTHGGGSAYSTGVTYQLDGSTVTASAFISGFSSASSRKLIITVAASAPTLYYYCYYHSGMGGAVNTNSSLGSSNFEGNTQAKVKTNTTAGFSIISWTARGNSSGTYDTFGHGLGVRPDWLILKSRNQTGNWNVYNTNFGSNAYNKIQQLSNTTGDATSSNYWGADNTTPSSSLVHVNQGNYANSASHTFIMYAFSAVEGYSKFGKYRGNGNANGTFIYTGFRPAWLLVKLSSGDNWYMVDNKRDPFNVMDHRLFADVSSSEGGIGQEHVDFLSNGFKWRRQKAPFNNDGNTYYYFAFAKSPFKNSRAR